MGAELSERHGDDGVVLHVEIPGIGPNEIEVEVEDGVLTVSGEHQEQSEERRDDFVRRERRYGTFSRSMPVPAGVSAEDVEVRTENGAIEVTIPVSSEPEAETEARG